MLKLESHQEPLASKHKFLMRLIWSIAFGLFFILISLSIGILGYHYLANLSWIDSFLNASMILSSMGPVTTLETNMGKLFSGFYALFCGVIFIVIIGVVLVPIIHRFFHKFLLK